MKSGALILGIIVSALLLAAAGVLYTLSGNPGAQHYRATIDQVRQIQQLSSSWSIEVARVRTDPLADFDALAAFLPRMARLKEMLTDASRRIPDLPDRLASDINGFLSAIDAQEERIERFKTGFAVVRNSARYLPLAAANVMRQAQEESNEPLAQSISMRSQDMNAYLASPCEPGKERLNAELDKMRESSLGYPPPLANAVANLLAHAEVLLARQAPTDELFQQATSNEMADLADRLLGNMTFELARLETLTARYERGLLAVMGVLAVFWIGLALHQRSRGGAVEKASQDAADALPDSALGADGEDYGRPLQAMAMQEELGGLPSLRGIDGELAAFASASPTGMSAEAAMLYRYRSERAGDNIAAAADRITARVDYLRQTQQKIQRALQGSPFLPELPDGADLDEELEASATIAAHVRREINGVADLAKRLASFSTLPNGDADRDMVDVNACVEQVVAATGAEDTAAVTTHLGDVPEIFACRTEIRLVLSQIIENSVRAVEELEGRKGSIKIDTASRNDEVLITIIDNGAGITPDRRRKIFTPFYTSRDGAMGLGLTLAGHLVKKYDGGIKVNSLPGQGTVTRITLPTGTPNP